MLHSGLVHGAVTLIGHVVVVHVLAPVAHESVILTATVWDPIVHDESIVKFIVAA